VLGGSAPVFSGKSAATKTGDVSMEGGISDGSVIESLGTGSRKNASAESSASLSGLATIATPTQYSNQDTPNQILNTSNHILDSGISSNNFQTSFVSTTRSRPASLR
jgi:hypothetical protein